MFAQAKNLCVIFNFQIKKNGVLALPSKYIQFVYVTIFFVSYTRIFVMRFLWYNCWYLISNTFQGDPFLGSWAILGSAVLVLLSLGRPKFCYPWVSIVFLSQGNIWSPHSHHVVTLLFFFFLICSLCLPWSQDLSLILDSYQEAWAPHAFLPSTLIPKSSERSQKTLLSNVFGVPKNWNYWSKVKSLKKLSCPIMCFFRLLWSIAKSFT